MTNFQKFCTQCTSCGGNTSKSYARAHNGQCKSCAIRAEIAALGLPPLQLKPCPLGIGTRGGKSRGKGSGSRLRLYVCECPKPVKVRVSSDEFKAHCDVCGKAFKRVEPKPEVQP